MADDDDEEDERPTRRRRLSADEDDESDVSHRAQLQLDCCQALIWKHEAAGLTEGVTPCSRSVVMLGGHRMPPHYLALCCVQVEVGFKLEDQQGPAAEWIALDPVQRDIKRKFRKMLLGFQTDKDGPRYYMDAIRRMCRGALALACCGVTCASAQVWSAYALRWIQHASCLSRNMCTKLAF